MHKGMGLPLHSMPHAAEEGLLSTKWQPNEQHPMQKTRRRMRRRAEEEQKDQQKPNSGKDLSKPRPNSRSNLCLASLSGPKASALAPPFKTLAYLCRFRSKPLPKA